MVTCGRNAMFKIKQLKPPSCDSGMALKLNNQNPTGVVLCVNLSCGITVVNLK